MEKILLDDERIKNLETVNKILRDLVEEYKNRDCEVYKNADQLSLKNYQYKAVLEEIREIQTTCLEFKTCKKCKFYEKCNKDIENYILNKINEVLK